MVETDDGRLLAGYIYWSSPPFRYLDLESAGSRAALRSGATRGRRLRLWPHAVSISRDRLPANLGDPPPAPPGPTKKRPGGRTNADEIALLVGEPLEVPIDTARRIYPRIGSGWPALEISKRQLLQLAGSNLPLHAGRTSRCSGCPTTVEDVTIVLRSGGLVSGLLGWHAPSSPMQGYDLRDLAGQQALRNVYFEPSGEVVLWPSAVSGPRRTFEGTVRWPATERGRPGFFRLPETALLVEPPYTYALDEIMYLLPGPSRQASPLPIPQHSAMRLLHEQPYQALATQRDSTSLYCFSYDPEIEPADLSRHCRDDSGVFRQFWDAKVMPPQGVLGLRSAPKDHRGTRAFEGDARVIAIIFDHGT